MKLVTTFILGVVSTLLAPQQTLAAEKSKGPWSGNANISFSGSKGNTDEIDLVLKSKIVYSGDKWKHSLNGELSIYENSGVRLSEEIDFSYNAAYFLNEKQYLFNHVGYEKDIAENIDKRLVDVLGYGHIFIKGDGHNLTSELGIGKRKTVYFFTDDEDLETVGYLGVFYDKKLTDKISIEEEVLIVGSNDNQVSKATTTLQLAITDSLSVGMKHKLTYTSNPPIGSEKTDSTLDVMLKYSF